MPIAKLELLGGDRPRAAGVDDDGVDQDVAPVAPVGAGVHAHAAAGRARDRRGELEAAEAGVAGAVQADRVRRPAAGDEQSRRRPAPTASSPPSLTTSASTPSSCGEHVRAEADRLDRDARGRPPSRAPPASSSIDSGPREPARRAAGADRREARERDALLERDHRLSRPAGRRPGRRRRRRARAARRPGRARRRRYAGAFVDGRRSRRRARPDRRARRRRACR